MSKIKRTKKAINFFDEEERVSDKSYLDDLDTSVEKKFITKDRKESTKSIEDENEGAVVDPMTKFTFSINSSTLKDIRDIVHTVKIKDDYEYSQRVALARAVELLKEEIIEEFGEIIEKPERKKR